MRRFAFRLQRVLDVKGQLVQEAKRRLAQALAVEIRAVERLALAQEKRQAHLALLAEQEGLGLSALQLADHRRYQESLRNQEQTCGRDLEAARAVVLEARQRVARSRQEERTLEILKERRWDEHQLEANRAEQAQLDEMAGRRGGASRWEGSE